MARLRLLAAFAPALALLTACDPAVDPYDDMDREVADSPVDEGGDDIEDGDDGQDVDDGDDGSDPGDAGDGNDDDGSSGDDPQPPPPAPRPTAVQPCDFDAPWGGYECELAEGGMGTNFCILVDGEELWTDCSTAGPECEPGEGYDMGCMGEVCTWNGEAFEYYYWSEPDCNTPLVLNFDGAPIEFSAARSASFDLSTDGTCVSTDWPTAPWLAMDRDGDGMIRDGSELFGNATKMMSGGHAEHGFAALAELDSNRDGKISAADEHFADLVLWTDFDEDRIGAYAELRPVAEMSLVSIDLNYGMRNRCDSAGNCGTERASFEYRTADGKLGLGEVVDVHLACR